jgi:hypothetical protein
MFISLPLHKFFTTKSLQFQSSVKFESYLQNKVVPSIKSIAVLLRNKTAGIIYGTVEG